MLFCVLSWYTLLCFEPGNILHMLFRQTVIWLFSNKDLNRSRTTNLSSIYPPFLSFSLFHPPILSFPSYCSQGWRISIAVELTGSVVLIGQQRGSTVAALTCVCIAEPQPGNTRSILMTSPTHCAPASLLFAVETSSLSLGEKRAGISKRTRAGSEEEGPPVSEWRGRDCFGGRRRVADAASGLGLAHIHTQEEKRRGNIAVHC